MSSFRGEITRDPPLAVMCGDSREGAAEFLRRSLPEELQDQLREGVRTGALDATLGHAVREVLLSGGFTAGALEVESLDTIWQDLVRRAVA